MSTKPWTIGLSAAAIRSLDRIPPRVLPAIIAFLYGPLAATPQRVGKPLRGEFAVLHGARRGTYRLLYEIDDQHHRVTVVRVAYRPDAYRRRV